jgi:hydrogenase maturation factor HypE
MSTSHDMLEPINLPVRCMRLDFTRIRRILNDMESSNVPLIVNLYVSADPAINPCFDFSTGGTSTEEIYLIPLP